MDRLSELLGHAVQFSYTALDRIVLNGYIDRLQRPENIVYLFRDVLGEDCIDGSVLQRHTSDYRAWVGAYAAQHSISILSAPKGERKEDLVQPYYRGLSSSGGVACILTALEQSRTFFSYKPRYKVQSGNDNHRFIRPCRKRFLHYYFYVLDPIMGPMSLRVATYLPFNITAFLNGHSFMAQEFARAGVHFRKEDNAFLSVSDETALQAASERLTPDLLRQRCDYWTAQLAPHFSPREQAAISLDYTYCIGQLELATDLIFKRSTPLKAMFQRAAELGLFAGGADRTTYYFGRRITRRYKGRLETVFDRRNEGHPTIRSYYRTSFVKQYEKADRLLRTETCLNDTRHVGIGRRLENIAAVSERMLATNLRYLEAQTALLNSPIDTGQLTALAMPSIQGQRRIPGIKLQDDRVIRLLEALLHPGGFVADWTSSDLLRRVLLRHGLSEPAYRLSQLRYDLSKLRAKGMVERIGNTRRYRVTPLGLRLGTLLVKLRSRLLGPLLTLAADPRPRRLVPPNSVDAAYAQLDLALDHLSRTLGLAA